MPARWMAPPRAAPAEEASRRRAPRGAEAPRPPVNANKYYSYPRVEGPAGGGGIIRELVTPASQSLDRGFIMVALRASDRGAASATIIKPRSRLCEAGDGDERCTRV